MSYPHRIVAATPADYPTIQQIAHLTWPDTFAGILEPAQIAYMLHHMYRTEALEAQVAAGHVFYLLLEPQTEAAAPDYPPATGTAYAAVGYVSYQLDYLPGTAKIHKLYVLPSTQGKGYGKALIEHVATIATAAGQGALRLDVNYQNRAINFYEHLGFQKIDRFDTDIGNGYRMEDWRMERPL
ncbi:GNAT family N-acetyltransferase [Neolewinella lacunae]|uniref:GNAT family N-acetyltransferase n=1 Tax=Neolewinella lacunae TaxID=1517758 RepID=A0A923T9T1_9BACT|nr:GNAT family N-acetyltransferase [Neolewinella lacunae]MBC6995861.1 GNAT family N-acetyltransferase [Neolewinella lacunae]MDN3636446.1 GNAT family N-acetyltransferase [Neolewinella lacunae]